MREDSFIVPKLSAKVRRRLEHLQRRLQVRLEPGTERYTVGELEKDSSPFQRRKGKAETEILC